MIYVENKKQQESADAIRLTFASLKFDLDPFLLVASSVIVIFVLLSLYTSLQQMFQWQKYVVFVDMLKSRLSITTSESYPNPVFQSILFSDITDRSQ